MNSGAREAEAGDVFTFPIQRLERFGAVQVLSVEPEKKRAIVTVLDWTGKDPATLDQLKGIPPLIKDFMFWDPAQIRTYAALIPAAHYNLVGNLPATAPEECRHYGGWHFDDVVYRQFVWNELPEELTRAFKESLTSPESVSAPGLIDPETASPIELKLAIRAATTFSDTARYSIAPSFRLEDIKHWPALYQIELTLWRTDLIPFMETQPMIQELTLRNHAQTHLDFSRTNLKELSLDIDQLESLRLPDSLTRLLLVGQAQSPLVVAAQDSGAWIDLISPDQVAPVSGLENIHGLRVHGVEKLSIDSVLAYYPRLSYLHVFGAPGILSGLASLPRLQSLESIWFCDVFGFEAGDFPSPAQMPQLTSIDLESVPADVVASVRRDYKGSSVEVELRKPRKPEWLAENLDYPLRQWDGREGMRPVIVKKSHTAYVASLREVRKVEKDPESLAKDAAITSAINSFLTVLAQLNAKYHFLYTLERDEVIGAVNVLALGLSEPARRAVDPAIEEALND